MSIAPKMLSLCRRVLRTTWYFAYRTCWASFRPISPWKRATLFWQALRLGWVQSKTVTRSPGKLQEWPISHSTWLKGRDVKEHYHVVAHSDQSNEVNIPIFLKVILKVFLKTGLWMSKSKGQQIRHYKVWWKYTMEEIIWMIIDHCVWLW